MLNLIIGKNSNLSQQLDGVLENAILVPTYGIVDAFKELDLVGNGQVNIIFNNFQTATALNDLSRPSDYIYRSIMATVEVLGYIKDKGVSVNKIIYTSSSSVYGNNIFCTESDELIPLNLHASLKISNEKLIEKFAIDNKIDYTIARVFNMYGGEDKFSIISKIIHAYRHNQELTIVNNGNGIRDFIHIDDVVAIYKMLLKKSGIPRVNVGTGEGVSVKNILDYLKNNAIVLKINNLQRDELKMSTANNRVLMELLGSYTFRSVEETILKEILG